VIVASPLRFAEDHTGPKQVLEAVVDALRPATPPPVAPTTTSSSQKRPASERSALVFQPAVPASTSSTPDLSPTATTENRHPEQLPPPVQNALSYQFPLFPGVEGASSGSHTSLKSAPFQTLRRGSLAPPSPARSETRRGSDPSSMELSRLTSPGAGPSTSRETVEMTSVSLRAGVVKQRTRLGEQGTKARSDDRTKEDLAMAKWRVSRMRARCACGDCWDPR
jgi:hypothetical protein